MEEHTHKNKLSEQLGIFVKPPGLIVLAAILIGLSIYWRESFFIILLLYGLFIKLLLSDFIKGRPRRALGAVTWAAFIVLLGLTVYVNYYMPHGPMIDTGDVVCQNDERGPCAEQFIEDLRNVHIPDWAKLLRGSEGELFLFGLAFAGLVISKAGPDAKKEDEH